MQVYKPKEFAKLINVSVATLQRWDREGKLVANRNPADRRFYTQEHYNKVMGIEEDVVSTQDRDKTD